MLKIFKMIFGISLKIIDIHLAFITTSHVNLIVFCFLFAYFMQFFKISQLVFYLFVLVIPIFI